MKLQYFIQPENVLIKLKRELYLEDAVNFRGKGLSLIDEGYRHFVIDMKELTYIDSIGLGVLIGFQKTLSHNGGDIVIHGISGAVKEIFELTRLTRVFKILN